MEEHLDIRNGEFKGLWLVKGDATKAADMWDRIEQIVTAYTQLHPIEMETQVRTNAIRQTEQLNDYGSNQSKNIRWGLSMPAGLLFSIQSVYPEFFENEKLVNKFMKRFKGLRICKTV